MKDANFPHSFKRGYKRFTAVNSKIAMMICLVFQDDCSSKEPLCFHLTPSPTRMNKILFDEAIAEWKKDRNTLRYSVFSCFCAVVLYP